MRVFYSPAYTSSAHAFDTTRKATWIAESLAKAPIADVTAASHRPLTRDQVLMVHDPAYVDAVERGHPRALAESQGFPWDAQLWPMSLATSGGLVAAARAALDDGVSGTLASGFHHACAGTGRGYCTFNGLVIAARAMFAQGVKRVLVLDLDAHFGGGTASLIAGDARCRMVDVSVCDFDEFEADAQSTFEYVIDPRAYLPTIERALERIDAEGAAFDLCLYNAGMDPYMNCPTGGRDGITAPMLAERERMVFTWAAQRRLPIVFTLAGGYVGPLLERDELVALHRSTLEAAAVHGTQR